MLPRNNPLNIAKRLFSFHEQSSLLNQIAHMPLHYRLPHVLKQIEKITSEKHLSSIVEKLPPEDKEKLSWDAIGQKPILKEFDLPGNAWQLQ